MNIRSYRPEDFVPVTALWRRARLRAFPDVHERTGYTVEQDHYYFRNEILDRKSVV